MNIKIHEFEISEEKFYEFTSDKVQLYPQEGVQTPEECKDPEYTIWGETMADTVKWKNARKKNKEGVEKDVFYICIQEEKDLRCPHCGIKFETEHHDCCPICLKKNRSIIDTNRRFSDELEDYRLELHRKYDKIANDKYKEKTDELLKKYNLKGI